MSGGNGDLIVLRRFGARRHVRAVALILAAVTGLVGCGGATDVNRTVAAGDQALAQRDLRGALIHYRSAVQQTPSSPLARAKLAGALLELGDVPSAVPELERALALGQPADDVVPQLARALVLMAEHKKVAQTYASTKLSTPEARASLQTSLYNAWLGLGDRPKAAAALDAALTEVPTFAPALLARSREKAVAGSLDDALRIVQEVVARDPKDHQALLLRGHVRQAQNDLPGAEADFAAAVALRADFVEAHAALFWLRMVARDVEGSKKRAEAMKAAAPRHPATAMVEANLAYMTADYAKARDLSERLLMAMPDNPSVLVLAGASQARMGSAVRAAAHFGKALAQNPGLDAARENLAETYIHLGQHANAMETLKPLIGPAGRSGRALALAGDAEMRRGAARAALTYYERAAKLAPDDVQIRTAAAASRIAGSDATAALAELQNLASNSKQVYADDVLFAALLSRRQYDEALAVLDRASPKRGNAAVTDELRGQVHVARRDYPAARASFERALKSDAMNVGALRGLVSLDLWERRPESAEARLQAAIAARPDHTAARLMLAQFKERNGAPTADVRQAFAQAVSSAPQLAQPRQAQIDYLLRKRMFKDALGTAQEALSAIPGDVALLETVGRAQSMAGDHEQATTTFRRLVAAMPGSARPYVGLAQSHLAAGKLSQAETALISGLEAEPGSREAQAALVDLLVRANRTNEALDRLRRERQRQPRDPLTYALESQIQARQKNPDAALAVLKQGVAATDDADLAGRQYVQLRLMGQQAEAQRFADSWIKRWPQDVVFEYAVAEWELARGELRRAEERLRRVVSLAPDHAMALNNLASILVHNGDKGAVAIAQRAFDLAPHSPPVMDTLAQALAGSAQVGEAMALQRRAIDLAPQDEFLRLGLARIALKAGDRKLAQEELTRLKGLGTAFPAHLEVTKMLSSM